MIPDPWSILCLSGNQMQKSLLFSRIPFLLPGIPPLAAGVRALIAFFLGAFGYPEASPLLSSNI